MKLHRPKIALVPAGNFVVGSVYTIAVIGSTTWTSIGAASNSIGITFTATGPGSGTGKAYLNSRKTCPVINH